MTGANGDYYTSLTISYLCLFDGGGSALETKTLFMCCFYSAGRARSWGVVLGRVFLIFLTLPGKIEIYADTKCVEPV